VAIACTGSPQPAHPFPKTGLVLLSLKDGAVLSSASVGSDLVAVIVADDGKTAYVADSSPGDVYAVRLPGLKEAWKRHVGGSPFGLLLHGGSLFVSLFAGSAVVALDPSDGSPLATYHVPAGPAVISVDEKDRVVVAGTRGQVTYLDGTHLPAGTGYALALAGGSMWTEDYERAELVRVPDGHRVGLPLPLFPFWLAPGGPGRLLISAEGGNEDDDPGGVFSLDTGSETFTTLARPRDPDQVVEYGTKVLVAAHGDKEVLAIDGEKTSVWASGLSAVALAPDAALNVLAVVVNDHE
jgi:outer membrane protein assembly factor BamB